MTEPPIISIREERPEDLEEILRIHEQAFSRRNEAKLVKTLCGNNVQGFYPCSRQAEQICTAIIEDLDNENCTYSDE